VFEASAWKLNWYTAGLEDLPTLPANIKRGYGAKNNRWKNQCASKDPVNRTIHSPSVLISTLWASRVS
jgi:hypothetical protein